MCRITSIFINYISIKVKKNPITGNVIRFFVYICSMITLLSLISLITIIHWVRIWDKSIKNKVSIREYIPKKNDNGLLFLIVPTVITIVTIMFLMITYLP